MKKLPIVTITSWNSILLGSVIFTAFVVPCLPVSWQSTLFKLGFTLIYLSAVFSLDKHQRIILFLSLISVIMEWLSTVLNLRIILGITRTMKILFFSFIVFSMIRQIATSSTVTSKVILEAITGYLLLGIVYTMFISIIMQYDPAAFNLPSISPGNIDDGSRLSQPFYFTYVTLATVGYGDIIPVKPYARSLATWISISGQLYVAIIIALLVGKYTMRNSNQGHPEK